MAPLRLGHPWHPDAGGGVAVLHQAAAIESAGPVVSRDIATGPHEEPQKMVWSLFGAVAEARSAVRIVTPYFLPDQTLVAALNMAALRGVTVDIVIPEHNNLRVVGWAMSPRLTRRLPKAALALAVGRRQPRVPIVHHSDRGSQYASADYRRALSEEGFVVSMSRRGDCYDNAPVESFFATLKKELVAGEVFYTREQARREIVDYIEGFYNGWRRHSALGYLRPARFEEKVA